MKKALMLFAAGVFLLSAHAAAQARLDQGKDLFQQGKFAEAIPVFQSIISNASKDYNAWYWLAKCYQKIGNLDSAEISARKVTVVEDEFQEGYVLLASILIEKNALPAAHAAVKEGIKAKKQDFQPLYLALGNVLLKMDSVDVALVAYSRARELDPSSIPAYVGEGEVYLKQGVVPMAAQRFEKALEVDSLQPQLLYNLRMCT
jgi:Tfp pilus assembly protein PilF